MLNRCTDAIWLFNKISKLSFSYLREKGLHSVIYVDDTVLGGDEF